MLRWRRFYHAVCLALILVLASACASAGGQPGKQEAPPKKTADETPEETVFFTVKGSPDKSCPDVADLVRTDASDAPKLLALVPKIVRELYTDPRHEEYTNVKAALGADAGVYGEMVANWCGPAVAASTWVVQLTFPKMAPSASMSAGQFMVSKTRKGWQVWYRYH